MEDKSTLYNIEKENKQRRMKFNIFKRFEEDKSENLQNLLENYEKSSEKKDDLIKK